MLAGTEGLLLKSFGSLADLASHLGGLVVEVEAHKHHALERAAVVLETEAKGEIGVYQEDAGPYSAWPQLADATQAERVAKGYSADEPLLRSGDLRDAITHEVEASHAIVGVPDDGDGALGVIAAVMENGSSRVPPRPIFGPAAFRKGEEAARAAGGEMAHRLFGVDLPEDKS